MQHHFIELYKNFFISVKGVKTPKDHIMNPPLCASYSVVDLHTTHAYRCVQKTFLTREVVV